MLSRNASAMSGNDARKISPSKKERLTSGQPAELTTSRTMSPKKTSVLTTATATERLPSPPKSRIFERRDSIRYSSTGAFALSASHSCLSSSSVPSSRRASTAWLTQSVSGLSFESTSPNCSCSPASGN